jgi:ubiquinone/menaquinone biosynthesis C-methylase UbiE
MQKSKTIVDYYRARAPEYEQIYYRDVPVRRKEIDDCCENVKRLAKNKVVLDLACGTGYWTKVAASSAQEVIGTDIAGEMVEQARQKKFHAPVSFAVSDIYNPPFLPDSFDLVILGFWVSHEPKQNYARLFEAITYPLKPDGYLWMIDNNPPAEGPQMDSTGTDEYGNNLKLRKLSNGDEFQILKNYFSKEELKEILSQRFKIIDLIHKNYYWSALLKKK